MFQNTLDLVRLTFIVEGANPIPEKLFVTYGTTPGTVKLASATTTVAGVSVQEGRENEGLPFTISGIENVKVGTALTYGGYVKSDLNGKAMPGTKDDHIGISMDNYPIGSIASIKLKL